MTKLPRHLYHNDHVYRTLGDGSDEGLFGLGFSLKSGGADGRSAGLGHYSLSWCLRGEARFDDGTTTGIIAPGSIFQRFPHRPHRLDLGAGGTWAECWLALGPQAFQLLRTYGIADPSTPLGAVPLDPALLEDIRRERDVLRTVTTADLPYCLPRIIALIVNLLVRSQHQGERPHTALIQRACQRMIDDPSISLEAAMAGSRMSYERFRKLFREQMGIAPGEFRIQRRLDRARALLRGSGSSIATIATELGYSSPFAFSNQFKRYTGMAPRRYRLSN